MRMTLQQVIEHERRVASRLRRESSEALGASDFLGGRHEVIKAKRVRQGEPKVRPWEQEWASRLEASGDWAHVKSQSFRVRLASGAWYKGDVSAMPFGKDGPLHVFEVKGGRKMKGVSKGILALKVAASLYQEIVWILVWKENGQWLQQKILP